MKPFSITAKTATRIKADFAKYQRDLEGRTRSAVETATLDLKSALRNQVRSAGLGQRLANTWRSEIYPAKGRSTLNPAGFVWSNAPHIIRAYDRGVTLTSKNGQYLAIPTDNVPKTGGFRGGRLTPRTWPEGRLGRLRPIRMPNGRILLVADQVRASYSKTGQIKGFRKASKTALSGGKVKAGYGVVSVPMFILIPQVSLRKKLDVESAFLKAGASISNRISQGAKT